MIEREPIGQEGINDQQTAERNRENLDIKEIITKISDIKTVDTCFHETDARLVPGIVKYGILSKLFQTYKSKHDYYKTDNYNYRHDIDSRREGGGLTYCSTDPKNPIHKDDSINSKDPNYFRRFNFDEFWKIVQKRGEYPSVKNAIVEGNKKIHLAKGVSSYDKSESLRGDMIYFNRIGNFRNRKRKIERFDFDRCMKCGSPYHCGGARIIFDLPEEYKRYPLTMGEVEDGSTIYGRVKPKFIKGILVRDEYELKELLLEIKKQNIKLTIPIYNRNGDVIWPINVKYDKLNEFLEKQQNE